MGGPNNQYLQLTLAALAAKASPTSPLHLPYICPTSALHLPYISPTSPLHLPYICPTSALHLPYISAKASGRTLLLAPFVKWSHNAGTLAKNFSSTFDVDALTRFVPVRRMTRTRTRTRTRRPDPEPGPGP